MDSNYLSLAGSRGRAPGLSTGFRRPDLHLCMSFLLLSLLLTGCASSPPPRIYLLATQADHGENIMPDTTAPTLQVQPILIPDYLDTTDLLLRIGPHEVHASTTGQWGERLSAGIVHALRADLAARLPRDRVTLGPPIDGAAQQILVTVDALDMWPDGRCVLIAHWHTGKRRGQGMFKNTADVNASDEVRVANLAGLIAQLAARIGESQIDGRS